MKIRNKKTGEIIEVQPNQLGDYGIFKKGGSFRDQLLQQNKPIIDANKSIVNKLLQQPQIDQVKKQEALARQIANYDRTFSQTQPETPISKLKSKQLKASYVYNNPYSKLDENGNIVPIANDRDLQGVPKFGTQAYRTDDGIKNIVHGLDAAMLLEGVGHLGYKGLRNLGEYTTNNSKQFLLAKQLNTTPLNKKLAHNLYNNRILEEELIGPDIVSKGFSPDLPLNSKWIDYNGVRYLNHDGRMYYPRMYEGAFDLVDNTSSFLPVGARNNVKTRLLQKKYNVSLDKPSTISSDQYYTFNNIENPIDDFIIHNDRGHIGNNTTWWLKSEPYKGMTKRTLFDEPFGRHLFAKQSALESSLGRPLNQHRELLGDVIGEEGVLPRGAITITNTTEKSLPNIKGLTSLSYNPISKSMERGIFVKPKTNFNKALIQEYNAIESKIKNLKEQEVLYNTNQKKLWQDFKEKRITGEEYNKKVKEIAPWDPFENPIHPLEKKLREIKVKQDIINTPQKNILTSEKQLGKNISDGGSNNKGVFEFGDNYIARLSAHGYDDASRLVNYADKLKSPRIMKTHQVKEINGKVYQVQDKATGIPANKLTEIELRNLPKQHIDNLYKDIAELEKNGLSIDISGGKSNVFYDPKKGFQFIDLGIGKMPDINDINKVILNKQNVGNNGMFDMTNPNIYKALFPAIIGAGALQQKQLGGKIYDDNGYLTTNLHNFTPKKIINSNHITTKNMAFPIYANGYKLYPNTGNYIFPSKSVLEIPAFQKGGGYYYNPNKILPKPSFNNMTVSTYSGTTPVSNPGFTKINQPKGKPIGNFQKPKILDRFKTISNPVEQNAQRTKPVVQNIPRETTYQEMNPVYDSYYPQNQIVYREEPMLTQQFLNNQMLMNDVYQQSPFYKLLNQSKHLVNKPFLQGLSRKDKIIANLFK